MAITVTRERPTSAGVPLDAELLGEVRRVQRAMGLGSRAAAMRYLIVQGLERLREREDDERALRRRLRDGAP